MLFTRKLKMKFAHVIDVLHTLSFPDAHQRELPQREQVLSARHLIEDALTNDEFLLDCIDLDIDRWHRDRHVYRGLNPFFIMPHTGIRFALGYWPPHSKAGAHEHTAWTITAVCHNTLEVQTYDRQASYEQGVLVKKNVFPAPKGKVGFIYEPGIHDPGNPTATWSLSLHVISPQDGQALPDHAQQPASLQSIGSPSQQQGMGPAYEHIQRIRQLQRWIALIGEVLAPMRQHHDAHVNVLINKCLALSTPYTRNRVERLMQREQAPLPDEPSDGPTPRHGYALKRSHDHMVLQDRLTRDHVVLSVQTPQGWVDEFMINPVARDAMRFVAKEPTFEVQSIPGPLTQTEKIALAEALEESGLFERLAA